MLNKRWSEKENLTGEEKWEDLLAEIEYASKKVLNTTKDINYFYKTKTFPLSLSIMEYFLIIIIFSKYDS